MDPILAQAFRSPPELWCWGSGFQCHHSCAQPWTPLILAYGLTFCLDLGPTSPPQRCLMIWTLGWIQLSPAALLPVWGGVLPCLSPWWASAVPGPQGGAGPGSTLAKSWPEAWDCFIAAALREAFLGRIFVNTDLLHLQMSGFASNFSDNAQYPEFCVIQSVQCRARGSGFTKVLYMYADKKARIACFGGSPYSLSHNALALYRLFPQRDFLFCNTILS